MTYVHINIKPETRKRLKTKAAQRDKDLKDHVDDLSRLPNSAIKKEES